MVEVVGIQKDYKLSNKKFADLKKKNKNINRIFTAVKDISFKAYPGEIYGVLGPNGAGKTTTMRCIATLLSLTKGKITVNGHDVTLAPEEVRKNICFLTNDLKLDKHFTPDYTVDFFGSLHGIPKDKLKARKEELFDYFGITEYKDKRIAELSQGMSQKLSIVVNLIHDPDVVIFDEPTNGLDIITSKRVVDYLLKLREDGKTVIISTHIMAFAQKICDRLCIVLSGKVAIDGTVQEVLEKTQTSDLEDAFFKLYIENEGVSYEEH